MCAESMKLIVVPPLLIDCLHALEEAVTLLDVPFSGRSRSAAGLSGLIVVGHELAHQRAVAQDQTRIG